MAIKSEFEIKTKRLLLCPIGMQFLHTLHEYASDYENTRYMINLPNDSLEETIEFLQNVETEWQKENPTFFEFAILMDDRHIGSIGITLEDDGNTGELGWLIHKKYWNQGIASESAKAIVDFSIRKLRIQHFIAHCDSENIGSYKVMEHIGMKRTDSYGGRKNRGSDEERTELRYEM